MEDTETTVTVETTEEPEPELQAPPEVAEVVEAAGVTAELLARVQAQGLVQEQILSVLQALLNATNRVEQEVDQLSEEVETVTEPPSSEEGDDPGNPQPIQEPDQSQFQSPRGATWLERLLLK